MSTSASLEPESEGFERLLRLAQVGLSSRAEAWPTLLGVPALRQTEPPDYFRDLLELATSGETSGETTASDLAFETRQIWLDLSRTGHPRFNRSADRTDLASVLLAYARRCPAYGWHPWRVLLAARLLLVGCDRETAFWCLVVNLGLGRVPRDLILAEILPRALVAPRHYWRHLPDAAVRTDVFQPEP